MAGVSRLQYSSEIRLVRVMCSGRVDLRFIIRALANGNDGVFIGGCKLGECNYVTHGNFDALAVAQICKKLMRRVGIDPARLHIAFMSGGDGNVLAHEIDAFTKRVKELGPLGSIEGIDGDLLRTKLEAIEAIVPFLRLAERERLRAPAKSKESYTTFFESAEFDALFDEVVGDKLTASQIVRLLGKGALTTAEIAKHLCLEPSEVSRHMNASSRHGWVKYDVASKRYALS